MHAQLHLSQRWNVSWLALAGRPTSIGSKHCNALGSIMWRASSKRDDTVTVLLCHHLHTLIHLQDTQELDAFLIEGHSEVQLQSRDAADSKLEGL